MQREIVTPRELLARTIEKVAMRHSLQPEMLRSRRTQSRVVIDARAEVAKRLSAEGVSEQRIARLMRISPTTVRSYLGREAEQPQELRYA